MSYGAPAAYLASASPQLGVPAMLHSDPLLQFKGARTVIKSIPASTGSAVGPGTAVQFQIPMSTNGYIKPNSMYLRFRFQVEIDNGTNAAQLNESWYAFAGQNGQPTPMTHTIANADLGTFGTGGAGSVIDRATILFPGGVTMTYNYYNHFRNAIMPHCLAPDFVNQDLRQLEFAGCIRNSQYNAAESARLRAKQGYVVHALDLPVFNSPSALPLLLLTGGITLEFLTASVAAAFWSSADGASTKPVTNYALSEMSLVYEEIVVSPEFKTELLRATNERPYSIGIADRTPLGIYDGTNSVRVSVGVGLSSVKAIVGTHQANGLDVTGAKTYTFANMSRWNLFINGQQITPPNLDCDSAVYAEFQRSLSRLFDHKLVSSIGPRATATASTQRTLYPLGQFAFGCSTQVYDDGAFALSGVPADQIAVEVDRSTYDANKWGTAQLSPNNSFMVLWALHDSVLTILPDGTVSIRK